MTLDILITHAPSRRPRHDPWHRGRYAALIIVALLVLAYAAHGPAAREEGILASADHEDLHLLVLGDTSAGSATCPSCLSYVQQYAAAVALEQGRPVQIEDETWRPTARQPADVEAVTAVTWFDGRLRGLVRTADIILLGVGDADTTFAVAESSCADQGGGPSCPSCFGGLDTCLRLLLAEIDGLRSPDTVVIVVATPDPGLPMSAEIARSACLITHALDGDCVDGGRLFAAGELSPHDSSRPDYELALRQRAHDSIARELIQLRAR